MAIIQLPPAPDGQSYVDKVTANGSVTVLVPTSTLSDDICAATGRTWAEEARLFNIQNAPDGKEIAGPGDPFYQTAESMKNRDKEITGLTAGALKIFNQLAAGTKPGAPVPNLSDTMDKIKDGSVYSNISSGLNNISSTTSALPAFLTSGLEEAKAAFAEKMAELQTKLPELEAKAATNVDILTKEKLAATGEPPTIQEVKAASGPLSIFNDAPALLKTQAENISKKIVDAQKVFAGGIAGIGASITTFLTGVPPATIDDGEGNAIPNPAYETFIANPENAKKLAELSSLSSGLDGAANKLTSFVDTSVDTSTTNLKAFGFAASLAKKVTGVAAAARDAALNSTAFNPASITQTFGIATTLAASIDTSMYKNTKDEDLTYSGDDGLVWDRIDAERQRRNLPGLEDVGTSRPLEPPRPQYGTTPPKDTSVPSLGVKTGSLNDDAGVVEPTRAVFDADPDEKVGRVFAVTADKIKDAWLKYQEQTNKKAFDNASINAFFGSFESDYAGLKVTAKKIEKKKPDENKRTPLEKYVTDKREWCAGAYSESKTFLEYVWATGRYNEVLAAYKLIYDAWEKGKTYKVLPLSVEEAYIKDGAALDGFSKFYKEKSYNNVQEYIDNNPQDPPPAPPPL
jgi:hypothetical protein